MTYFEKASANAEDVQRLSAIAMSTADSLIEHINEEVLERVVDEVLTDKTGTTAHFLICRFLLHIREMRRQMRERGLAWVTDERGAN